MAVSESNTSKQRNTDEDVDRTVHAGKDRLGAATALKNPIEAPNTTTKDVGNTQDSSSHASRPEAAGTPPT